MLVDVYLAVGDLGRASEALDQAFDTRGEHRFYDAELHRQRGAILIAGGTAKRSKSARLEQAEESLEHAIEIAAAHGTRLLGLRAIVDLCRLRLAAGKHDERVSDSLALPFR